MSRDARQSHVKLGAQVGLSANAVAERVRRLEHDGVITGYHARTDPRLVGRPLVALVDQRLAPGTAPDAFEPHAARLDESCSGGPLIPRRPATREHTQTLPGKFRSKASL